jgi:uncharacterized protein YjdB
VGAGDIAQCDSRSYSTDTLLQGIPGTVFTVGDNAYPDGSDADFTNCYNPTWGREKARTYPAIGNHEYNLGNANAYFNYFGQSFGYPNGYYSYNLGSWHIVVLNSMGDPFVSIADGSPQLQWLKADLAANQSFCSLAIWHHSRFYSPLSSTDPGVDDDTKPLWVAVNNAGVDVVLTGHEHQYERFAPQDNDGNLDLETGLRSFVVGTGGSGLAGPNFTSTRRNSEVKNGVTWGVFKMTLHPTSYDWKFIPIKGQTFADSGSASCHGTRPLVSAGYDQVVAPNVPLNLIATFTDYDNSTPWNYTINWGDGSTTSGTATTPAPVDSIRASHTYVATGQYLLTVAVTDNTGLTGSSKANVTVTNANILVAAGNISRCDTQNDDRTADLLDRVGGTVITVGDNTYASGSLTEFQNCYAPTWGRSLPRTLPVPGDKDYQTSGASGYFSYFGAAAGQAGKGYYSYDLGTWHIIAMNSSVSTAAGSAQELWLKADLAATNKRCVLAYFHYPLFGSQSGSQVWGSVQPLWNDLYAARADVVLGSHFQFYERFAQQTPAGVRDSLGGIREFVVGTGGQSWTSFGTPFPTSQVRSTQTWGVLKLTLNSTSYSWQFLPIQGQTFTDAGSTDCHTKGAVASVAVSPSAAFPAPGGTVQLTATPLDGSGNPLLDRVVTWSSSNTAFATVSASGLVTAVASGSATITARSESKSGTAAITVTSAPVATVTVSPAAATITAGYTQQLSATLFDANGNVLTGRVVTWASDNSAVATVSNAGLVTAVAPGTAHISATSEGKSGSSTITVNPAPVASVSVSPTAATVGVGATQQITATLRDALGNILTGRVITWTTDASGVATVDGNGLVTAGAAGTANITATSEGKSATAAITVTIPVASVTVSPPSATILVGGTEQLTATPLDAGGNPLTGRTIIWSTDTPGVATVNASGLVTAVGVGSATITATSEGKSGSAAITVNPVPVASVSVSPASATVFSGATQQLTATPLDANGNPLTGRTISWSTDDPNVATVNGSGLVTAGAAGTANITATSEGKSGTATITVMVPVASVSMSPLSATILVGGMQQLTATPLDAGGNPLSGRAILWSTDAPGVATVNASGLVTAVGVGSANITATSEGKSASAAITVNPVPVASVSVSPSTASVFMGTTQQLVATPLDANGNPLTGRLITWATDAPGVATVNGSGLVTAVATGVANITATSEGKSGSSAITVPASPPPVTLVGAGNIANCGTLNDDATAALIDNIPGTVYTTGDNIYGDGSLTDFQNCYGSSWGRHKARTKPASGNKDYAQPGAAGYWQYFGAVAGDSGKYYYSYDAGAWHVVVLNSQIDMTVGSPQEAWLKADLAASPKRCTVAIWDQPRFSSSGTSVRSAVKPLWDDLYAAGADLVLNAHYRVYERFAPQTPAGVADPVNGIRQFTVGTGGSTIDVFGTPIANSEVRATNLFGVLKLTLADGSYSWQFIPIAGQTFTDSGSGSCH